ncbi:MAG: hypothetical protein ACI3VN_10660 [Candidatus Onthomonas sp.]
MSGGLRVVLTLFCLPALPVLLGLLKGFDWLGTLWKEERGRILLIYLMAAYAVLLWYLLRPVY